MTPHPPRRRLRPPDHPAADPTTPIYNTLATQWAAAGRAVPDTGRPDATPPHLLITDGTTHVSAPAPMPTGYSNGYY